MAEASRTTRACGERLGDEHQGVRGGSRARRPFDQHLQVLGRRCQLLLLGPGGQLREPRLVRIVRRRRRSPCATSPRQAPRASRRRDRPAPHPRRAQLEHPPRRVPLPLPCHSSRARESSRSSSTSSANASAPSTTTALGAANIRTVTRCETTSGARLRKRRGAPEVERAVFSGTSASASSRAAPVRSYSSPSTRYTGLPRPWPRPRADRPAQPPRSSRMPRSSRSSMQPPVPFWSSASMTLAHRLLARAGAGGGSPRQARGRLGQLLDSMGGRSARPADRASTPARQRRHRWPHRARRRFRQVGADSRSSGAASAVSTASNNSGRRSSSSPSVSSRPAQAASCRGPACAPRPRGPALHELLDEHCLGQRGELHAGTARPDGGQERNGLIADQQEGGGGRRLLQAS